MRFVDLFAGLGGFHLALRDLGHECVFASELDIELRAVYEKNFKEMKGKVFGDIRECKKKIPAHDILCAGFPCQPFSKSGAQKGMKDKTRGTLFHEILEVLQARSPKYVILENVGNFEMHDNGRTWQIVRDSLEGLGYFVKGTEHVTNGGHGLVSPHHLGFPHTRERFFIVASRSPLPSDPFPKRDRERRTSLSSLVLTKAELSVLDKEETTISDHYVECINHWNKFLQRIPSSTELPSFPIWGDEIGASYPFEDRTPFACSAAMPSRQPIRS
ncbi:MAG: DNA (cytosine-5-)-methyltransferase, partial [Betaproteobacteria bacterium]